MAKTCVGVVMYFEALGGPAKDTTSVALDYHLAQLRPLVGYHVLVVGHVIGHLLSVVVLALPRRAEPRQTKPDPAPPCRALP